MLPLITLGTADVNCIVDVDAVDPVKLKEKEVPPTKYFLSTQYVQTLINHKARHEGKGNGFGAADPSPLSTEHQHTWLHLKTHWDLAGEFEFNPANEKLNAPAGKVDYKE